MTPLAQRIALAKLEGFQWYWVTDGFTEDQTAFKWRLVYRPPPEEGVGKAWIGMAGESRLATEAEIEANWQQLDVFDAKVTYMLDYLNDLNTIHRLEARLQGMQQFDYWCNLGGDMNDSGWLGHFGLVNATAAEKAEAILKTLGLWEDS